MLEYAKYFFDSSVDENCTNKSFKYVTHDFTRLKDLNLSVIHFEVLLERVSNVAV